MLHKCKGEIITLDCGCVLERCDECQGHRSISKCELNAPQPFDPSVRYTSEMQGVVDGLPRHREICKEFEGALKVIGHSIPFASPNKASVLDVGAGIGIMAPLFMAHGYKYEGLEPNDWAARYIEGAYGVAHKALYEDFGNDQYEAVVSAHSLEHVPNAPAMLEKMHNQLLPAGYLYLIVPDDEDLRNPEHTWFFKESTIRQWLAEVGFINIKTTMKRVVAHEQFIYCVAQKPWEVLYAPV